MTTQLALPSVLAVPLETVRLRLVPLTIADAQDLEPILADESIHTFIGTRPMDYTSLREQFAAWEKRYSPDGTEIWLNWTVRLLEGDQVIGHVQATVRDGHAALGYIMGTEWQGQGYASEACREMLRVIRLGLAITNVTAEVHPEHVASHHVAAALGLQNTGITTEEGEQVWSDTQ